MSAPNTQKIGTKLTIIVKEIGYLLLLFCLPMFIGTSVWYFLSTIFGFYNLNPIVFYALFSIIVPVTAFLANLLIIRVIEWSKQPVGEASKHPETKGKRIIKVIVTGIIIPIALSVVAELIPVSDEKTVLTILLNRMKYGMEYPFISKIGDTVIASGTETKIEGVRTLETIHSTKSLDELFRIFVDDHQSINNYDFYYALSTSMASFPESRDRLLEMFVQSDEFKSDIPRGITPNLFDRYFSQAFKNLRDEISKNILDPQKRDEQLLAIDEIELLLKTTLLNLENQKYLPEGGDPTLDFVLDTLYQMDINKDDKEVYFLARNVAVDPTYAIGTRVKAIRLWANLGTTNDFEQIVTLLDSDDEQIRQAALQAIATIHIKSKDSKQKVNVKEK